jgi:hypothetical protein
MMEILIPVILVDEAFLVKLSELAEPSFLSSFALVDAASPCS